LCFETSWDVLNLFCKFLFFWVFRVRWHELVNLVKVTLTEVEIQKKCVAYPQEDFLFTILHGDSWRHRICRLNPKSKKNYGNTKSINQNNKFLKKNCVSYFKSGKRPKICPYGICRPDPKSLKNYKNIKSTNQNEIFPKKKYG
jgi:hypothetical protein